MPFFTNEHDVLRKEIRSFVEKEITPFVGQWEEEGDFPKSLYRKLGEKGYLGLRYPKEVGGEGKDYFSAVVFVEELARCGCGGIPLSIAVQTDMAVPPIAQFGNSDQIERFVQPALRGEKVGAIGISEPNHGSNVAGIETKARHDGNEYIINGTKTFITNGTQADFITLVVRTSDKLDHKGISLIIVELDRPGVSLGRKLEKVGMRSSDTAEIIFDNVRVPRENLLGKEGTGFAQIMWELQGERMIAAPLSIGIAEYCYEIVQNHLSKKRNPTSKDLQSLAQIKMKIESVKGLTYAVAEQFNQGEVSPLQISMVKYAVSQMTHKVTQIALQVLGTSALHMTEIIQRLWRDTRLYRIGGGTDEIMKEIIAKQLKLEVVSK